MGEIMRLLRHIFLSRSFERDEAGATRQKSRQRPQKRRFAGAIGAGDLQRLAAREHETEIFDHPALAAFDAKPFHPQPERGVKIDMGPVGTGHLLRLKALRAKAPERAPSARSVSSLEATPPPSRWLKSLNRTKSCPIRHAARSLRS